MKKFLIRSFILFSIVFIFFFIITNILEAKNKEKLNKPFKIEVIVKNEKIIVPDTPDKVEANLEFSEAYYFCGLAINITLPILFLICGGIKVIKDRKHKRLMLEGIELFILYSLFSIIIKIPKSFFSGFYRTHLMGLSKESVSDFASKFVVNNILDILISLPIIILIYIIFMKSRRWYYITPIILIVVSLITNYVYPYIDEVTNDLTPMQNGYIKEEIIDIARKSNIENIDIRVVEKSKETTAMNAYMTGIGNTRRIVFWDTSLMGLKDEEILSVAAHEIGHYKLNHILKSMLVSSLIIILTYLLLHNLMRRIKGENYRDIDNLPLILLLLNIIMIVFTPVETAYSRKQEVEADRYAIEMTNDPITCGILELRFIESNLSPIDVSGLYKWLAYDHPTTRDRIEISNEYSAENY